MSTLLVLTLAACGISQPELYEGPSNGRIGGVALDQDGERLANVQVELSNGMVTTTDADGLYAFSGVQPDDYVLSYDLDGFTDVYRRATITGWERVSVDAMLYEVGAIFEFSTEDGGVFEEGIATLSIPAGPLVDEDGAPYEGPVELHLTVLDPSTFSSEMIPGPSDYSAQSDSGATGLIFTFGSFEASMYSPEGDYLNLTEGNPADVEMTNVNDLSPNRSSTGVDLWWFDTDLGLWVSEGQFEVEPLEDGTSILRAELPHFTWWNGDEWSDNTLTCVTGTVVDTMGNPVPGASVTLSTDVIYWSGVGGYFDATERYGPTLVSGYSYTTTTDANGFWELDPVNAQNPDHTLTVSYTNAYGETVTTSEPYETGPAVVERAWCEGHWTYCAVDIDNEYCENVEIEIETCALGAEYRVLISDATGSKLVETENDVGDGKFNALAAATAWYFDPGDAPACDAPIVEVEMGSCVELGLGETPLDVIPDLSGSETFGAGEQVSVSHSLYTFELAQRTTSGQPYYIAYALDMNPPTEVSYDLFVPGDGAGFPGYSQVGGLTVPAPIEFDSLEAGTASADPRI